MGTAQSLIRERLDRGERVVTIGRDATAFEGACVMNEHHIGALVVTEKSGGGGGGEVVGIFTERDLLKRVVAEGRRPEDTRIGDVMTNDVIICTAQTSVDEIRQTMREKRIRHMPVVDDSGGVIGMISIGDLNLAEARVLTETISYLEQYMTRL